LTTLKGEKIYLRALEPEDLDFIYSIENDESIWHVSNTQTPYSKFLIRQYLENAHQDIFEAKQLRLAICLNATDTAIGLIDLFEFDPTHQRAGVGIVISNDVDKNNGIGTEALSLIIDYAFKQLQVHQLFANIGVENEISIALFSKFGFEKIGIKKDWNKVNGEYEDEILYQLLTTKK
jgi:diamine N-acetyltransferase